MDADRPLSAVSVFFFSLCIATSLSDLTRSDTAGHGKAKSSRGMSALAAPPVGPPVPPVPPIPFMEDPGARMGGPPMEPPFRPPGPPNYMGMGADFGMSGGGQMPSSGLDAFPSAQQDPMTANQYTYPQNQPIPVTRNDDPYAYPYNMPKPAGLYSKGPVENPQLTLGGFPYVKPAAHDSFETFSPVTLPPVNNNGEYSYDWSFNSNANQPLSNNLAPVSAPNSDEVLTVRDLMASPVPKVMPRQATPKPVTKRCTPDDIVGSSGICAGRSARRAKCGGLVSSMSKDCGSDELCCFAVRKNNTIISVSVKQSQRQCVSPVAPKNPGFCSTIADRQKNCAGLVASSSPDCLDGHLCCFSATPNLIEIQIVGSPPKAALTSESDETACFPSIKPEVQGVCAKRTIRPQRCRGMLSATSNNCHQDELCCFFLNGTSAINRNKQQLPMQSGSYGQGGGGTYYQVPTYQTPTTTSTTTSRTTVTRPTTTSTTTTYGVTYPASWYQGATTPYYFPYKPDRLCVPSTNPAVYDGTCVASSMIQYLCSGLQAGTSLNCGYNEYCCYSNKPLSPPSAAYGCVPDNNPNIADGFCTNANDLSAKCSGISISTSRECGLTQFCCYSGKVVSTPGAYTPQYTDSCAPNDYPTITNGRCVANSQYASQCNGVTGASSQCQSNQLCCYNVANNYGYPQEPSKTCAPQANKNVNNGTCVSFSQIAQQCKGIQISPSLDCGYSQYCCYTSKPVESPPSTLGCIPENNPTITNGTCVDSGQISSYCKGMQISISGNCPIMSFCCYPLPISTSTTSTTTPRTPPNTPTTYSVTAYPTPAPPAVTYAYPPSGEGCTPDNNPSVNNGFCVAPAQLTALCKGIQIAPSKGCSPTYFCCYKSGTSETVYTPTGSYDYTTAVMQTTTSTYSITPSTTRSTSTTTGATVYCSPETLPTVGNGRCVVSDQLSIQCKGINIATSRDCPITSLCCFNATGAATADYTYGTSMSTPGTTTIRPTTTSSYYAPSPAPQPVTDSYYYKPSGAPYVVTPAPVANRSCSPQSNRQIKNGYCVSSSQISQKCRGIQISPSLDCLGEEYCCYQAPDVLDVRPGGACIPQSNPKILNGVCVDSDQIGVSCKGVQMSTSRNCKPTQFCCFNTNDAYSWGYGYQPPSQYSNRQRLPAGSCKPNGRANTDNINGICVETSDIMVACKQWQVARSGDCQSSQYCCFSEDTDISNKVQRPQQLPNRDAVLLALASNSQDQGYGSYNSPSGGTQSPSQQNQNYGGYYAPPAVTQSPPSYYSANPDTTRTPPTTATVTLTPTPPATYTPPPSTATTTVSRYTQPQTPAPTRSCRPMSYPSISNGICVASSQISQACSGIQVSPSLNCYGSELCCFTNPLIPTNPTTPTYVPYITTTTTPATTTTYTTPTTTTTTSTTTTPPTTTTTTPTTTTTTPTTSTTYTTPTTTRTPSPPPSTTSYSVYQTPSNSPSYNYGGYAPSSSQCIPDSMPVINNGRCIDQASLSDYCRGIQISTSRQCGIGFFCCFTMTDVAVPTVTPPTMSPTSATTPTSAIPTTTPATTTVTTAPNTTPTNSPTSTVTTPTATAYTTPTTTGRTQVCNPQSDTSPSAQQGLCVAASMISVACNGLQLSTSLQCGTTEFCCYKPSVVASNPSAVPAGACIPDNYPFGAAASVLCVNNNQLAQKCAGMEISTSRNCAIDQMCCYIKSSSFDPKVQNKISLAVNTECIPVSDRSQKGKCVPETNLTTVCKKMQMSMSGDCNTGEFCCFQRNKMDARPECVPSSDSSQKGKCVRKSLLPECKNMQMSMSDDCNAEEFCCFTRSTEMTAGARSDLSCSPETNPEITNGFCLDPSDVATGCQGAEASTSNNCQSDQLCCFKKDAPAEGSIEGDDPILDPVVESDVPVSWPRSL